jgi:hypothetical protein
MLRILTATRALCALCVLVCVQALAAHAAYAQSHVSAEYLFHRGSITLTPSAGGAAFTAFQQDPAILVAGQDAVSQEFMRRVSAQTTATAGLALTAWLSPLAAIQLAGAFTPTRFRVTNDATQPGIDIFGAADTTRYARLDLWTADASLILRPPLSLGRVYPYAVLGGGVVRYQAHPGDALLPPEARDAFARGHRTQWSGVLGAGAVIPLQRNHFLLSFGMSAHISESPLSDDRSRAAYEDGNETLILRPDGEAEGSDGIALTTAIRLTTGLVIPLRLGQ